MLMNSRVCKGPLSSSRLQIHRPKLQSLRQDGPAQIFDLPAQPTLGALPRIPLEQCAFTVRHPSHNACCLPENWTRQGPRRRPLVSRETLEPSRRAPLMPLLSQTGKGPICAPCQPARREVESALVSILRAPQLACSASTQDTLQNNSLGAPRDVTNDPHTLDHEQDGSEGYGPNRQSRNRSVSTLSSREAACSGGTPRRP